MNLYDLVSPYKPLSVSDDVVTPDGRVIGMSLRTKLAAADLGSEETVDKILSLGLISGKNVGLFISHIPELRAAESAVAEMLTASRLGQPGLNEEALQSTLYALNEAIEDLEALSSGNNLFKNKSDDQTSDSNG